jgi:hypothetical protein
MNKSGILQWDAGYSEQLSTTRDNLSLVAKYKFESHRENLEVFWKKCKNVFRQ